MELIVPLKGQDEMPLYEQIYRYIKEEIKATNLRANTKLPSTRELAKHLKVSRSTTQMAYDQLVSEGYIVAVPCRGYFVAEIEELVAIPEGGVGLLPLKQAERGTECLVDFSPRGIDLLSFPFSVWRKISRNTLVDDNKEMFRTGDPQGEPALREAIREYLHSARGVNCSAQQIILGAGNEYLLMLLSQIIGTDLTVAMENPTYKQAYRVFDSLKYHVSPVEMDQYGMDAALLEESRADVAYVMPSHQYPMGIVMPIKRRLELLGWALHRPGRYLVEDDYDSEFRYKGKPIPSLQGIDQSERVIYIGTFSNSIAPAIRIAYMVLPAELLKRYREKCSFYASTVSRIDQNILCQFIQGGYYERHLNRMRGIYKTKHDTLLNELRSLSGFTVKGENAGLHVLLTHQGRMGEEQLVKKAMKAGIRVYGLSGYFIHPAHNHYPSTVLLGYANLSEEEIVEGIGILREAWRE